ncbi:MAG: MFS transporter, partial [Proteobacteria bacterium]|nr:MFS transporter [Pseudomonadota bacterium]
DGTFSLINIAFALTNLAQFSIMLLSPFYLSNVSGLSPPVAGLVLASSPLGIMLAAPLAGRLVSGRSPWSVAIAGMAMTSAGLLGISMAGQVPHNLFLAASMFVAGFGAGLFQVAYFDILTAAIPQRDRGVAGALGMVTRSIGVVTGATVLMLVFQLRQASQGLVPALQLAFLVAAAIPAVMVVAVALQRLRVRRVAALPARRGTETPVRRDA